MPSENTQDPMPNPRGHAWRFGWLVPLAVATCFVFLSALFWRDSVHHAQTRAKLEFEHDVASAAKRLSDQFRDCETFLQMGAALIIYSDEVTFDEWQRFVEDLAISEKIPGVNGLAYVRAIEPRELDAFIAESRAKGMPGFARHVHEPELEAVAVDRHYIVQYYKPIARNQSLWGLDIAANPVNREVYDEAMESGDVRLSRAFPLYQTSSDGDRQTGIVMTMPVFEGGGKPATIRKRRSSIHGWVALSFDAEPFIANWWDGTGLSADVVVTEQLGPSESNELLRRLTEQGSPDPESSLRIPVRVGGRDWTIEVHRGAAHTADLSQANASFVVGVIFSLLVGGIVWSLMYTRLRAEQIAEKMTFHLRRSEDHQRRLAVDADEANRMKSLFIANMSHDVRTPMTAILGYTRLLEEEVGGQLTSLGAEAMAAIQRSGEHLLGLINDILDLSKMEAGRFELASEPVAVRELIAGCIGIVRPQAEEKGIELRVSLRTPIPDRITGDPTRLRQILLNLLGNAVKFTDSGHVSFEIWQEDRPGISYVCFEIEDTGIGMDKAEIRRVFEPFVQADPSHTRLHGGTGLGLTIAHHLVDQMAGHIEVASAPGQGSRFLVRVPGDPIGQGRISSVSQLVWLPIARKPGGISNRAALTGRVLLVEDGPDTQKLVMHLLGRVGLEVELAVDGLAGVEAVERSMGEGMPFDVVLLDMQLPKLDGYGVARELREMGYPGWVVALTAHAMMGDRKKCIAAGCDAYLSKPFNPDELIGTVRQILETAKAA